MPRPREFEDAQVIRNAMEVFWRKGYQGTSVQDLVDATGVQRGSLYGAFGDKRKLFLLTLDDYADVVTERFSQMVAAQDDPVDGVRAIVRMAEQDCLTPSMAERGCLIGNTCNELAAHDDDARARIERFIARVRGVMAEAIAEGQRRGTFDPARDPHAVAAFVQCNVQGMTLLAKTRPEPAVLRGIASELLRALEGSAPHHPPAAEGTQEQPS